MATTALDEDGYVAAFRRRQEKDLLRWRRRRSSSGSDGCSDGGGGGGDGGVGEQEVERRGKDGGSWDGVWRNEDGATLADYGVDEDAEGELGVAGLREKSDGDGDGDGGDGEDEDEDDENFSLAELLRRKRGQA